MKSTLFRRAQIPLLLLIFLVALDSMWGLIFRNGYYAALVNLRDFGPHLLPMSDTPLQQSYTGIRLLDYWLMFLQCVLANVTDGNHPALSVYSFQFAGQLVSILVVLMIEGMRHGNQKNLMGFFTLWGLAMQGIGFGIIMPLYGIAHLLLSPTATMDTNNLAENIHTFQNHGLNTLVLSVCLGFMLPSITMSLPFFSAKTHQFLIAIWQFFPIWISGCQFVLGKLYYQRAVPQKWKREVIYAGELYDLYRNYFFAFIVSTVTHLASIIYVTFSSKMSYADVFMPANFRSHEQIRDMVQGAQNFLQYDQYVGSTAAIAWAIALHYNSTGGSMPTHRWAWLILEVWCVSWIAGPAGALVTLMWNRDERVIEDDSHESRTTKIQ